MKTKHLWISMTLVGALAGYALLGDDATGQTCYTAVTVNSAIDSANNITVNVTSGAATICTGLEAGDVCRIPVQSGTTLGATFNTNRSQFVYVQAAGTNKAATINATQTVSSEIAFAVVGVQGTSIAVEGDPKIQLVSTSCN